MNFIKTIFNPLFLVEDQTQTASNPTIEITKELTPTQKFNLKLAKAKEQFNLKVEKEKALNIGLNEEINKLKSEIESQKIALELKAFREVGEKIKKTKINHDLKRDTLSNYKYLKNGSLQYVLGHTEGENALVIGDIAKDAQLLISGRTGSGKTVTMLNVLTSIAHNNTPQSLKISLIDPKILTFGDYRVENSPFLNEKPSIGDDDQALLIIKNAYESMMKRYHIMRKNGVKNYRKIGLHAHVIFIDEIFELLEGNEHSKEILKYITKIASLGRAGGVHLVLATQSPRAKTLGGTLKANLCFIGHKMSNGTESNLIHLPESHKLRGKGDGYREIEGEITRFQATFLDEEADESYTVLNPKRTQNEQNPIQAQNTPKTHLKRQPDTIELDTNEKAFKALLEEIINTVDENGKLKPKGYFIDVKKRDDLKKWSRAINLLHKEKEIVEYQNGKGYFLCIDYNVALNILEEK